MKDERVGPLALGALWFSASVSLAEIATGGLFADAGFARGTAASVAGHAVGALLFFGAGWISWKRGKRAVAVCGEAFGRGGPILFGALNFVQLVGWTAVMIVVGARSLGGVLSAEIGFGGDYLWRAVLGACILAWAVLGPGALGRASTAAAAALVVLCAGMSALVFGPLLSGAPAAPPSGSVGFGALFELALVMPLSWLPLVGDYVADADKGRRSILASAGAYAAGSVWMYALGLGSMLAAGTGDPVQLMGGAWMLPALAVVLLSTVTTAFLDARSAGISLNAAAPKIPEKAAVAAAASLGLVLALVAPVERYESFLLLIGSVFAPLYAVLFADFLLRRPAPAAPAGRTAAAFLCWAAGVAAYQLPVFRSSILGTSLPVMALVGGLYSLYVLGARKCV